MKALVAKGSGSELTELPSPRLKNQYSVRLNILTAGICKTDIAVATGRIPTQHQEAFGHEFSAEVLELGSKVKGLQIGQRVAVNPLIPCQTCSDCCYGNEHLCGQAGLLGIHQPGAFCQQICVPAARCYPVQPWISDKLAAYAEPLAAMLSILDIGLSPSMTIGVIGSDRIATLCRFILQQAGFENVDTSTRNFDAIIQCSNQEPPPLNKLNPGGILAIKTRLPAPLQLNTAEIVTRRLQIIGANYAKFSTAIHYLHQHAKLLQLFLGRGFPLESFKTAFESHSDKKYFFDICAG